MRPLTAVNGLLLGSCLAISVSLAMVLIVFLVLGDEYPRLQGEFRPLSESLGIFTTMTLIAALSFYSLATNHRRRHLAQVLLIVGLLATGWYYWP
jgi:hypothetical protein